MITKAISQMRGNTRRQKNPAEAGFVSNLPRTLGSASEGAAALPRARGALLGFVDPQCPTVHLKAVKGLNRPLRLALGHLDETEAAWPASLAIVDELHRFHLAVTLEQRFHVLLGGIEGQIAHIDRRHPEISLRNAHSGEPPQAVACAA